MRLTLREFFLFREDYEAEQMEADLRAYNIAAPLLAIARGLGGGDAIDPAGLFPRLKHLKMGEGKESDEDEELALLTRSIMENFGSR